MEKNVQSLLEKLKAAAKSENPEAKRQERAEWVKQYKLREQVVSQALLTMPVRAFVRYQRTLGYPYFYESYWRDRQIV